MSKTIMYTLGDLITLQRGFDITKAEQSDGVYPVISSSGINSYHSEYKVEGPGVVIGRKGTLGTAFYVEGNFWPHDTSLWVKDFNGNDPYYVYCLLSSLHLEKLDSGSANPTLNRNYAHQISIKKVSVDTQKKIGAVIKSIDDKFKLNTRVCTELESMAKTLYDYWFVQFDFPDENGKPYRISGGAMEWNEQLKREIPKGWTAETIGNLLSKAPNTTRIQTSDYLRDGSIPVVDQSSEFIAGYTNENSACLSAPSGYIVFGDHTRIVKYIRFPFARGADGTQILKSKTPCVPEELLYQIVRGVDLSNQGYARHFKFLKDTPTIVPKETVAQNYTEKVRPIHDLQTKLVFENVELTKLRDWLLPMLMNGQATVLDSEPNAKVIVFQNPKPEQYEVRQAARSFGKETTDDTSDLVKEFIKRRNHDAKPQE